MAAFWGDEAWNCEMCVPPSNSKITVNNSVSLNCSRVAVVTRAVALNRPEVDKCNRDFFNS